MEDFKSTPVIILAIVFAQVLFSTIQESKGQGLSMEENPSYHRVNFRMRPDGRPDMSHGNELDQFFGGSGSSRNRAGMNGAGGMFRPRIFRAWRPRAYWRTFRF